MEAELLAHDAIVPSDLDLFTITDSHDEIMEIIRNVPVTANIPFDTMVSQRAEMA